MWMAVGLLSFSASVILVIVGLVSLFKKKQNTKKVLLSALACFAVFIIALSADASDDPETAEAPVATLTSSDQANIPSADPVVKETSAEDEKKEADRKAKEEADAKAAADKKAAEQAAAEKAELEAAEKKAAEAIERLKKSKAASVMTQVVTNLTEGASELDDKTREYLVTNYELFPAVTTETKAKAASEVDTNITSRHLFKNIAPYLSKMVVASGNVVQISEEETDFGTLAVVHILNDNGDSLIGVYLGSTGDILDGDYITFRGVPTASYSFSNVGGGTTNAILLTLSTIQKEQ